MAEGGRFTGCREWSAMATAAARRGIPPLTPGASFRPGIYTRVAYFEPWIHSVMDKEKEEMRNSELAVGNLEGVGNKVAFLT